MTFQDLILALQGYWAAQGCVLAQAYDVEVGAGRDVRVGPQGPQAGR